MGSSKRRHVTELRIRLGLSAETRARRHHHDVAHADSLRLPPAEENDTGQLLRADKVGISQQFAIFLEADAHFGVDICLNETGCDVDHAYIVRRLPFLQRRAKRAHRGFAGMVDLAVGPRRTISDRTDIDDRAALARLHASKNGMDTVKNAFEEHIDLVGYVGDAALFRARQFSGSQHC